MILPTFPHFQGDYYVGLDYYIDYYIYLYIDIYTIYIYYIDYYVISPSSEITM